jgi:poly-gamma-glutamate synthesis protein (capsule biosynthesis protein)
MAPAARVVNLETSITRSDQHEPKGITYRMHPDNIGCLRAAAIDICILANNHVLDYGPQGLIETLETLERAGIRSVGAGRNRDAAVRAVVHALPGGRHLIVGACAHESSGVPDDWAALNQEPGVNLLPDLSKTGERGARWRDKLPGDVAACRLGSNWGYDVPRPHQLRPSSRGGGIDIVYGYSRTMCGQ